MKITKRPIYEYECQGPCGENRKTLVAERAIDGICTKCKRNMPDPNQQDLFGGVSVDDAAKGFETLAKLGTSIMCSWCRENQATRNINGEQLCDQCADVKNTDRVGVGL